ncbi:AMP-binding protein [Sphaerisporangium sp. NPDC049003]|uniref:AMP-binding protein n=1 Tax=Sphaerisporangium sp. NPDC049003 TaxID=3364517 RepID=UPI0037137A33
MRECGERGIGALVGARRVPPATADMYYAQGWWRRESFVDDLRDAASAVPGRTAFVNWRGDEGREVTVTFGELAVYVGRLSAGLRKLGVRPGDAVAFQLPNWWETAALTLACLDAGAVAVPMMMTMGPREVERILAGTQASVCVTVDRWNGSAGRKDAPAGQGDAACRGDVAAGRGDAACRGDVAAGRGDAACRGDGSAGRGEGLFDRPDGRSPARVLADLGDRLPWLRHCVVIGDARTTGAIPFTDLLGPLLPGSDGSSGTGADPSDGSDGSSGTGADPSDGSDGLDGSGTPAPSGSPGARTPSAAAGDGTSFARSDEVSLVLFTSGTTGEVKGVLHTPNTQYASTRARRGALRDVRDPRVGTPADLTHSVGMRTNVLTPLVARCTSVFADTRDPDIWLDLLARHHVTHFLGAPEMLGNLVRAQRRRRRPLPGLRLVTSTGAPLPASFVAPIRELLCPGLVNGFGMTETGGITLTAADDPPDWPGQSIGRPTPGREVRLLPDAPDALDPSGSPDLPGSDALCASGRPGPSGDREVGGAVFRLWVRGSSVCVGTFELGSRRLVWAPDTAGGWYDTGDLVAEDGRGGLRYLSRVADRVGSPHPIPVLEVEDELLGHPAVADVAIVGCQNTVGEEMVCAVVVPEGTPPTLDGLRDHLLRRGMTEWYLPTHLACVDTLPRNPLGKVLKNELRERLLREPRP